MFVVDAGTSPCPFQMSWKRKTLQRSQSGFSLLVIPFSGTCRHPKTSEGNTTARWWICISHSLKFYDMGLWCLCLYCFCRHFSWELLLRCDWIPGMIAKVILSYRSILQRGTTGKSAWVAHRKVLLVPETRDMYLGTQVLRDFVCKMSNWMNYTYKLWWGTLQIEPHSLVEPERDYLSICKRYSKLYVVPDFSKVMTCKSISCLISINRG